MYSSPFSKATLKAVVEKMDFTALDFDVALRYYFLPLSFFHANFFSFLVNYYQLLGFQEKPNR